jgi:hypothetical protein
VRVLFDQNGVPTAEDQPGHAVAQPPTHLEGYSPTVRLGDWNQGPHTAVTNDSKHVVDHFGKPEIPVGYIRSAMSSPV